MLKFRYMLYLFGIVIIVYLIKQVKNRVENSDEFVYKKKMELEELLRQAISEEIDEEKFLKDLEQKFKLSTNYEEHLITKILAPRLAWRSSLFDDAFSSKSKKLENRDNFKYISWMEPVLYQFVKGNIDESEFYEMAEANHYECKNHTWEIKVFENDSGTRNFSLYKMTENEDNS